MCTPALTQIPLFANNIGWIVVPYFGSIKLFIGFGS